MVEWGYLLKHLGNRPMTASEFREAVIKAEREVVEGDRIPLLVDIVLTAIGYAGLDLDDELSKALMAAGYLSTGEDGDDLV